ncbi:allantoinase [Bacillus sp. 165]|uniref:allantoinase n=1 Tax=Bacillus sp. 165 TaxID=1529117 RepID=UPI001ADAD2AC|nr:allantoinase [Bacillus sp. 165]MBO9129265.1 allantoinase [Bacillus sp. 165]
MTKTYDLIIKGGHIVLAQEIRILDIAVKNGVIVAMGEDLFHNAVDVLDVTGQYVLPGIIDAHVHFNDPGRTEWEGFSHGSCAMAAGGCTTYFDMPLNNIPATTDSRTLLAKAQNGSKESFVDFALWGGLVPGNEHHLEELASLGIIGFKAFLSHTGTKEFDSIDDLTLYQGMKKIAKLNKVLALHSESNPLIERLAEEKKRKGLCSATDYIESRPIIAEMEAVNRALLFAKETGCSLHFVHISSKKSVDLIQEAKKKGLDVTVETCPHYLLFNRDDFAKLGAVAKCAPPLRSEEERLGLWEALTYGHIDFIASDHSPCPTAMKSEFEHNMFKAWGGITGGQFTLEAMIDQAWIERGIPLTIIARWLATNPAIRFGLYPQKGNISLGADADFAVVDLNHEHLVTKEDLFSRHQHSPYIGKTFRCQVTHTINRGNLVYTLHEGIKEKPAGQWIQVVK